MRQAQKKREKDKVQVALILAFCVIALTSIFTIKSNIDKINDSNTNVPVSEKVHTEEAGKNAAVQNEKNSENTNVASSRVPIVESGETKSGSSGESSTFVNPVKSDSAFLTNEYSMDHLIYSVTLDQYMTHCGVDIEAPEDTQVIAMAAGCVTSVYTDDRYGKSIEITHSDGSGLVSVYSNLSTNEMVEVGDNVKEGQIIGGVGSTGLFESLEPSHLHLEMLKDGVYVDPQKYINF